VNRIPSAEASAYPWFAIVDPSACRNRSVSGIANAITGVWFTREDAEAHLRATRYNYGPKAAVYCFSGHKSHDWRALCSEPAPDHTEKEEECT
jgi:hypothetical protein